MSIWITNAYDATNIGDDFLLREVITRARIPDHLLHEVTAVCNHPETVRKLDIPVIRTPHSVRHERPPAVRAVRGVATLVGARSVSHNEAPRAVLAMAGGYSSLPTWRETLIFSNDHLGMIDIPRRHHAVGIMFPVSVGPLNPIARRRLFPAYSSFEKIFVRDDESQRQLRGLPNVVRVPDLAVQAVALRGRREPTTSSAICVVARDVVAGDTYSSRVRKLGALPNVHWRLQVPRDANFYQRIEVDYDPDPIDYLSHSLGAAVTVSVRLHGALMSILNGVPAVHIAYDRKGPGAYRDLGIQKWLHSAEDFDPEVVMAQAEALASDPSEFWDAIDVSRGRLLSLAQVQDDAVDSFWRTVNDSGRSARLAKRGR